MTSFIRELFRSFSFNVQNIFFVINMYLNCDERILNIILKNF